MVHLSQNLNQLFDERRSYVLVTLVGIKGSAPQEVGAKMLVTLEGLRWGTVGGGKIEAHCIRHAQKILSEKKQSPELHHWNLQREIGMSCGGEVSMFFDPCVYDSWQLYVFGAGHVAQELCRILQTWTCHVNIYDTRKEWLDKIPPSHNLRPFHLSHLEGQVKDLPPGGFLLSMTHGHSADLPILREAFRRAQDFAYIGVIGSDIKAKRIKKELSAEGVEDDLLKRLHCPIGLPLGGSTPPEMAVSIAAQLLQVRDQN